jgi:hypothetical protein
MPCYKSFRTGCLYPCLSARAMCVCLCLCLCLCLCPCRCPCMCSLLSERVVPVDPSALNLALSPPPAPSHSPLFFTVPFRLSVCVPICLTISLLFLLYSLFLCPHTLLLSSLSCLFCLSVSLLTSMLSRT